ncbi:MAG: electron transport complex subunit RsxB [Piscirickettsiaceae bacterium]|nr:electron transport complex subunit RsxB [Piscirickettsiaceae bacterium]
MFTPILAITLLALIFGLMLGFASIYLKVEDNPIIEQIDKLLPQTQCGQCNFAGCRPYAKAIANGEVDINRCPPGGEDTIQALANLLEVEVKPLDKECGIEGSKTLAVIDEERCIGCTLCIQACPVDAIIGAAKQMHTVVTNECTGCELCVNPCPVDCIDMVETKAKTNSWNWSNLSHIDLQSNEQS